MQAQGGRVNSDAGAAHAQRPLLNSNTFLAQTRWIGCVSGVAVQLEDETGIDAALLTAVVGATD